MKASISIPDELWEAVRVPNEGVSRTVQRGLAALIAAEAARVRPAPASSERAASLRSKLAREARGLRDRGYAWGLSLAESLSWGTLEALLDLHAEPGSIASDLEKAGRAEAEEALEWPWNQVAKEAWDRSLSEVEPGESGSQTFLRGAEQAFHDLHQDVLARLETLSSVEDQGDE